jgi:hypothetical protein
MGVLLALIIRTTFGLISMAVASSKGRSKFGWFVGGFLLGLIGLIIVLCLGDVDKRKDFRDSVRNENKRLREKLRKEKMKNEQFREHTRRRLDKHDEELQLDTRDMGEASLESPEAHKEIPSGSEERSQPHDNWYYKLDDRVVGPIKRDELENLIQSGQLSDTTEVRYEGWDEWSPAVNVPFLNPDHERG